MEQSRYHVLGETLHAQEIPNMLGRVVVDTMHPLRDFVPNGAAKIHPQDIVQNLPGAPIYHHNIKAILDSATNISVKARLTEFFHTKISADSSKNLQLEALIVTRYSMDNIQEKLDAFMNNKTYKKQVLELLERNKKEMLPMVTGMLTCEKTYVGYETTRGRGAEAEVRLPVGAATNTTSTLDPQVETSHTRTNENRSGGTIKQEVIFALTYDEVILEGYLQRRGLLGFWKKKKPKGSPSASIGDEIKSPGGINMLFDGGNDSAHKTGSTAVGAPESTGLSQEGPTVGKLPFVLV